ncbi:MAG: hypothetical protein C0483_15295 [Pirellula sp.]|nr:hypothetical protein [Pirellula sp.]
MSGTQVVFDIGLNDALTFAPALGNDDGYNFGVELVKDGQGTLTLTGDSPFISTTYVDRGTLVVNGALGSFDIFSGRISLLEVDDFGTLAGTGTVRGYVDNYGHISPGTNPGDIGTLRIDGVYLQGSEAVYDVDINAAGQSDRIEVSYVAQLTCGCGPDGGDLVIRAAPGTYTPGQRYTILTTGFGVFDTFGQVTTQGLPYFWSVMLEYDAFNAYLVLNNNGLAGVAQTFNQYNTSVAVMNESTTTDPQLGAVFTAMTGMSADGKRAALDQLSAALYGTLTSVGLQNTENYFGSISSRLRPNGGAMQTFGLVNADGSARASSDEAFGDVFGNNEDEPFQLVSYSQPSRNTNSDTYGLTATRSSGSRSPRRGPPRNYGWVGGYGVGGNVTGDGNAQGFHYGFGGSSAGVDRYVGGNTVVGLAGGYANTSVHTDNQQQTAQVDSYQGALYASRVTDRRYLLGIFGYNSDSYDTTRQLPANLTARGNFDGHQLGTYVESGLMRRWGNWNWQPSIGMQYISLRQDGFTETGAGGAGLNVLGHTDDSFRGNVGLRFTRPTQVAGFMVIPNLHARYGHEFLDVGRFATANFAGTVGNAFTTAGNQLGRNFGQYGVGVNTVFTRHLGAYAGYDLLTAERAVSHTGSGGLQLAW